MSDAQTDQPATPDSDTEQDQEHRSSRRTGGDAEAAGSIEEREDVAEELVDDDTAQDGDDEG